MLRTAASALVRWSKIPTVCFTDLDQGSEIIMFEQMIDQFYGKLQF
jgi:hypothetical protein